MTIGNRRVRTMIAASAVLAPRAVRRFLWRRMLGYDIHPTAAIGRSLIDVDAFRAGPRARVASLSILRGCERVEMSADSYIGPLVWVNAVRRSAGKFFDDHGRDPALVLHRCAGLTSMHFIDCSDRVELHEFSVIGGMQSQLLTHAFDFRTGHLTVGPIEIGAYTLVSTRAVILPGTDIGAKCIIAAGAVLPSGTYEPLSLYAGVPGVHKADLSPSAGLFVREEAMLR